MAGRTLAARAGEARRELRDEASGTTGSSGGGGTDGCRCRAPAVAVGQAEQAGGAERWGQGAVLTSRLQYRHGGLCLSQEHRPPGRLPSAAGRHRGCAQCFAAAGSGVFLASVSAYAFCAFISNVAL